MPTLIKPFHLGLTYRVLRVPPKNLLVMSVQGLFDFDKGPELDVELKMWPLLTELLGEGVPFDPGMPKIRGEVLLGGKAMAPAGRPTEALALQLKIASIEKRLAAVGQRYWKPTVVGGYEMTRPTPFTECPLDFRAAFGGVELARNPSGKGHGAKKLLAKGAVAPLPTLEDPGRPVSGIDDAPEPAAFGPLGPTWPQRSQYAGTYDMAWAATRWPDPPVDMRLDLFNEAPRDQQIEGFFRGDERFTLGGMNAAEPVIQGKLPGVMGRCFVKKGEAPLREVPMRLDTVWLFGCARKGVVIFRAVEEVLDSDAADVDHIMVGHEKLGDPRRPLSHYEEVFRLRTAPDTKLHYVLADSQLGPIVPPEELERREAERRRLGEEQSGKFKEAFDLQLAQALKADGSEEQWARARAEIQKNAPGTALDPPSGAPSVVIPMITPGDLERMDIDLAGIFRATEQIRKDAEAQIEQANAQLEQARRDADAKLLEQGIDRDKNKEAEQRAHVERLAGAEPPTGLGTLMDVDEFLSALGHSTAPEEAKTKTRDALSEAERTLPDTLLEARRISPKPMEVPGPLLPSVAVHFGELIQEGLRKGRSYRGRDLAGVDLRGVNLAGLDLSECFLERANLEGADLSATDLTKAVLTGANLRGAKLARARLREANLCEVDASGADLSQADLTSARMMSIKLTDARLREAQLGEAQGMLADLSGAQLQGAFLHKANLLQANLEGASADGATLTSTVLLDARLTRASFRAAKMSKAVLVKAQGDDTSFDGAELSELMAAGGASFARASFREVQATRAGFHGAVLDNASFERAVLDESDFGEAKLRRATLSQASLKRAILSGADLRDAALRRANLFEALLRKANLDRADLEHASLHNALVDEASLVDTRLAHVTTGKTRIRR